MAIELYPHQMKAVREMHNGCILAGEVGSGKSLTALAYFVSKELGSAFKLNGVGDHVPAKRQKDLYIITTAKKRDSLEWQFDAASLGIVAMGKGPDAATANARARAGGFSLYTVDSWNNIGNYEHVKDAFFIFDEQRLVGSGAWVKSFYKLAARNRWILLSATPGDSWMEYIPVFVANGYYKNRTEFIREHVVWSRFSQFPKVDRYVEQARLRELRAGLLVEMPYLRHTKRHVSSYIVDYDKELFDKVYKRRWNPFDEAPVKDISELFRLMRRVVNSDPARLGAVMKLMEKHPRLIIFYNFNYELKALQTLGDILNVTTAEWNGSKHQDVPEGDRWLYFVQYTAGAEGWNCITTDAIIFYSLNYSYKINEQARGRIDRLNTPYIDLYYYMLRSESVIDDAIMKAITTKQTFNEKKFAKKQRWVSDGN